MVLLYKTCQSLSSIYIHVVTQTKNDSIVDPNNDKCIFPCQAPGNDTVGGQPKNNSVPDLKNDKISIIFIGKQCI